MPRGLAGWAWAKPGPQAELDQRPPAPRPRPRRVPGSPARKPGRRRPPDARAESELGRGGGRGASAPLPSAPACPGGPRWPLRRPACPPGGACGPEPRPGWKSPPPRRTRQSRAQVRGSAQLTDGAGAWEFEERMPAPLKCGWAFLGGHLSRLFCRFHPNDFTVCFLCTFYISATPPTPRQILSYSSA